MNVSPRASRSNRSLSCRPSKVFPEPLTVVSSEPDGSRSIDCSLRLTEYVDSIINQRGVVVKIRLTQNPRTRVFLSSSSFRDRTDGFRGR